MTISASSAVLAPQQVAGKVISVTPTGFSAGDLMIVAIACFEPFTMANLVSAPPGWDAFQPTGADPAALTSAQTPTIVGAKVATAADIGSTFTFTFNANLDLTMSFVALHTSLSGFVVGTPWAYGAGSIYADDAFGAYFIPASSSGQLAMFSGIGASPLTVFSGDTIGDQLPSAYTTLLDQGLNSLNISQLLQSVGLNTHNYTGNTFSPFVGYPAITAPNGVATGSVLFMGLIEIAANPLAPTPVTPIPGEFLDATSPMTFSAVYNPVNGQPMADYGLRVKQAGGSYFYWNNGNWSTNPAQVVVWTGPTVEPGDTFSVTVPAGLANGPVNPGVWDYGFRTIEASAALPSPFSADTQFGTNARPTVTILAPTGTVDVPEPTFNWSETFGGAAAQRSYRIILDNSLSVTILDTGDVTSTATSITCPQPLVNGVYLMAMHITDSNGEVSTGVFGTFTVAIIEPNVPTVIVQADNDPITEAPEVQIILSSSNNLLDQDTADLNNSVGTWVGSQCIPAISTIESEEGQFSMIVGTPTVPASATLTTGQYPCGTAPMSDQVSLFIPSGGPTSVTTTHTWYKADGTTVVSSASLAHTGIATGSWQKLTQNNLTPPPLAAFYTIELSWTTVTGTGGALHVQFYVDEAGVFEGTTSPTWSPGGYVQNAYYEIQSGPDGVVWNDIFNSATDVVPIPGQAAQFVDRTAPPGQITYYRARIVAVAQDGFTYQSAWVIPYPVQTDGQNLWWLQIPGDLDSAVGFNAGADPQYKPKEVATVNYPLGRPYPVKVTDGVKGRGGILNIHLDSLTGPHGFAALRNLIEYDGTLLLQAPDGFTFYIAHDPQTDPIMAPVYNTMTAPMQFSSTTFNFVEVSEPT